MIIKFSLRRLSLIFLLVIVFPLVQKQWLNLYLFNINNFTIYKVLYYLSGLIVPILIIINSLNKFTFYKFNYNIDTNTNTNTNTNACSINGRLLFLITSLVLSILSILISNYILINLKIFINSFLRNNDYFVIFDIDKQVLFFVIISTFLIFKKTKFVIKKIVLTNFFIFSIINWYLQINNHFVTNIPPFYFFKFGNINFINITFILAIESFFYVWSYISYSSNLSDWKVPKPYKREILPILNIVIFYLLTIFYYSILF